jgi:hypothetical protein
MGLTGSALAEHQLCREVSGDENFCTAVRRVTFRLGVSRVGDENSYKRVGVYRESCREQAI